MGAPHRRGVPGGGTRPPGRPLRRGRGIVPPRRGAARRPRPPASSTDRAAPSDVDAGRKHGSGRRRRPGSADGDTTHLCAVDADGLGMSLTQSNALDFGSHLVAGSTGIFLHNRGVGFSLVPGHPGRTGAPDTAAPHPVPHAGHDARRRALASRRRHGGRRAATDPPAGSGPDAARRPGPGHRGGGGPCLARRPGAGPFRLWWGDDLADLRGGARPGGMDRTACGTGAIGSSRSWPSSPTPSAAAQIISVVAGADGTDATLRRRGRSPQPVRRDGEPLTLRPGLRRRQAGPGRIAA